MPRSVAATFRALVLAVLPLALLGACAVENGVTPTCVSDIDANGIKTGVENGCTGFAICRDSNGNEAKPATCCKDAKDLDLCLFAYGVGAAPTTAATTTSTGTGTGSGGAGGGP